MSDWFNFINIDVIESNEFMRQCFLNEVQRTLPINEKHRPTKRPPAISFYHKLSPKSQILVHSDDILTPICNLAWINDESNLHQLGSLLLRIKQKRNLASPLSPTSLQVRICLVSNFLLIGRWNPLRCWSFIVIKISWETLPV